MAGDWLKLHRKIAESAVFANADLLQLFVLCLVKAGYADRWIRVDGLAEPVQVQRGQFMTGRFSLHRDLYANSHKPSASDSTVWRRLETLQEMGCLNIETNRRFSIVTVVNYEAYQSAITEAEQADAQPVNSQCTTGAQPVHNRCTQHKKSKIPKKDKNSWSMEHLNSSDLEGTADQIFTKLGYTGDRGGNLWKAAGMLYLGRGSPLWIWKAIEGVKNLAKKPGDLAAMFYTFASNNALEDPDGPFVLKDIFASIHVLPVLPQTAPVKRGPVADLVIKSPPAKPRAKDANKEIASMADELKRLKSLEVVNGKVE